MAIMPATFTVAQEEGTTLSTDTTNQDSIPALSKRELRRQRVARRNLHYNILGGPSYTPDFGLLIGGSGLMTFRMNPSDTTQQRSVVPVAIALMFNGGLNLFSKPQLFFKGDRFRIFGQFSYKTHRKTFTASATAPIRIMCAATPPASIVTADCRSTPGSCSAWAKATSLPVRKSTSIMTTCTIRPNTLSTNPLIKRPAAQRKATRTSVQVSVSC